MAIMKEVLDELFKDYKRPDDITSPESLLKQMTKAPMERALDAEMTDHLCYEKHMMLFSPKLRNMLIVQKSDLRCPIAT